MARVSDCCDGPPPPAEFNSEPSKQLVSGDDGDTCCDGDSCCERASANGHADHLVPPQTSCCDDKSPKDTCCKPESTTASAVASCHDGHAAESTAGKQPVQQKESCQDRCYAGPSQPQAAIDNVDQVKPIVRCCSTPTEPNRGGDRDSYCDARTRSCSGCDTSCLDRVALRACEQEKGAVNFDDSSTVAVDSRSTSQCRGGEDGKPCDLHVRVTRATYASTMEALGCICRALLALGQESCCVKKERSSVERRRSPKRPSSPFASRSSIDSCCASSSGSLSETRSLSGRARLRHKHGVQKTDVKSNCVSICCKSASSNNIGGGDGASCCDEVDPISPVTKLTNAPTGVGRVLDLERGFSDTEHTILSITGMTCSGCETKLSRTLSHLDSVKNLKTSLVLSRAEFDLDLRSGSLAEIVKHLERTTEFKCERITNNGSGIDIIAPGSPTEFVKQQWPDGVTDMTVVNKTVVQVAYDPKLVGARALIETGWPYRVELAPLRGDPTLSAGNKHVRRIGYWTLFSIVLTIPVLVLAWAPLPDRKLEYGCASLVLATIVQVTIAGPFYPQALKSLIFSRVIEMDLLIVLSTSAAYIFSVVSFGYLVAGNPLSTGEFFETSTLLVTLIMVGRYAAALARQKAVESISIRSLQVSTAVIVDKPGTAEREVDIRLLQYGDIFKVSPDCRVPTDGTVISGSSEVDESMMTGESKSVEKYRKSCVIAGTVNGSGTILVRLTRLPGDNTINTIATMVDESKLTKPRVQELADRVASYFVPVVVALSIITFAIWIAVGITIQRKSGTDATIQAITFAITVLIVSCPCAIGLAVPMVVVITSGVAAERGVIFKSSNSIEVAHRTSHVVFDKTGTLTKGKLSIVAEEYLPVGNSSDISASLLLGLVSSIKHPVSVAVASHLKERGISAASVTNPKALTGKGVEGTASGQILRAGNSRWLGLSSDPHVEPILSQGNTAFCFTINGSLAAVFGLDDSLRPDAASTVTKLAARGISVHILSGDDDGAVQKVASQLGISDSRVRSRCAPADKQTYIRDLLAAPVRENSMFKMNLKPKEPVVIFCGDGTNDAVALAQATVGVHMNEGTDVAKSAADVVLMRPSIVGILDVVDMSKRAVNRIKFNFAWSFVYNVFAVLLASGAFISIRIPPEYAGLGELVSVLPVISAAVLLRWSRT